jgi:glycosyltransferase involved in cell wall biosynthesis/ribosomal protein S18 acetylase RimI-like enzyme
VKVAHLATVDLSLRYLLLPQLEAAKEIGESIGISAPGEFVSELEQRGIRHIGIPASTRGMSLTSDLRAMGQLWRILRRERPDILHTHNPKPGVYGRILGRLAGVPIVVNTVHGLYATPDSSLSRKLVIYGLEALASRFSDAELVQNPEDLELLRRLHIAPADKLGLLGNGVDLDRFNPESVRSFGEETRRQLGIGPEEVVVGFVGRLVAEKGIPELIEAAAMLGPEVTVFVVGPHDPDKDDDLGEEPLEKGRREGVRFLGMRRDIEALYGAFDIFVLPSHREGFPRAAMEAAASGLPVIATDIRGCRQVVEDGVNGLLVPVRDPARLAEAISRVASDPDLRREMGEASARRAKVDFDEARVVDIVMSTYRRLAREKGLGWALPELVAEPFVREAEVSDAPAIARLHAGMIGTGFLSSLGVGFLRVLYRALIESERGTVMVADADGTTVGFIAGTDDTGAFYKEFVRRHFLRAAGSLLPALTRSSTWTGVWETLRYGGGDGDSPAELLSMAVAPSSRRSGLGSRMVQALLDRERARGVSQVKVVVGAGNQEAIAFYERCGFDPAKTLEVHRGVSSLEMTWRP